MAWSATELTKLREIWLGRRWKKRDIEAEFPGRSWSSIVQKARVQLGRKMLPWSTAEEARLVQFYPVASRAELAPLFPGRTFVALEKRATEMGILRERTDRLSKVPIIQELRRVRRARKLKADDVAKRFGGYGSGISAYETGAKMPTLTTFLAWVSALGLEIVLQRTGLQTAQAKPLIEMPGKHRLMGRSASVSARRPT